MLSVSRFRSSGVLRRVLPLASLVVLLFVAGCSTNNATPPPTAPGLAAAVSSLGNVSPNQVGASYTITVSNGAGKGATSGAVTVTDPPTNFTVTAIAGPGWTCTLSTLSCTRSDSLAGGQSYPPITVTGNVTGSAGQSISIPISISGGGLTTTVTSSPAISIVTAPTISKAFGAAGVAVNASTSLTFTITNPSANTVAQTGLAFTDTLPTGIVVATPNALVNNCGGTATATAGSVSVSLSGGTVAASANCTVTLNVSPTAAGSYTNVTGNVTSTNGGSGNTATANLTATAPPTISKAFGAAQIQLGASTSLTFTVTNPAANTAALTGMAFTDTLPSGLVVATPSGLTNTCAGTATATSGSGSVSLSGGSLAVNSNCTISLNVTGTAAGTQNNTTQAISSTQSGAGATSNTATLTVVAPPTISKAFGATGVGVNGSTSLTFSVTNPAANTVALTGVAFTDSLPVGIVVATPNALVNNCGGTATAAAGSGSVSLSGSTIAVSGSCTVVVNVTATAAGTFTNVTGNVTSTNGGTGGTATANLSAAAPPTISKAFAPTQIPLNGFASLTFTITNPAGNPATLTGVAFTDTLPAGLVVANPNGLTNNCGGTPTATAGSGSASLTGASIAANSSCTLTVNVKGTAAGPLNNTTQAISSTQSGAGAVSNTATLTVIAPPTISKGFGASAIPLNGSTSLTFTLNNPNASNTLSGVSFSDTLPTGMTVSSPNGLTGSCGSGTITAAAGSNSVTLSGGTLAAPGSCSFGVNITSATAGANLNTTSNVSSTEGGTGLTASATLNVVAPPTISKAFGSTGVAVNGTTSLTFTLTNPSANTSALTGVAFTDTLPAGMIVATPNGLTNNCGGIATATAGSGSASLSGGTIAVGGSCTVIVNVIATAAGSYTNTTGAVSSTNGGIGNTATANLTAATPPTISKAFGASQIQLNASTSLTFTITNPPANTITLTGVAFTDSLPAGLAVATPNGLANTCGGTATATAGAGSLSLSGASVTAASSCTLSVNVTGTTAGAQNNTTQAISSTQTGAGATSNTATVTVIAPPTISKQFGASAIVLNGSTTLSFTIANPNSSNPLDGIGFTDTLTSGLQVSSSPSVTNSCGGAITATPGSTSVSLSGGTLAGAASCTITVSMTGTTAGTVNNTTGAITSTEGGTGATSNTASLAVLAPPTITSLSSNSGSVGSSLTITGTSFGSSQAQGSSTVTLNGVTATPSSWSSTSITITVPSGATGTGNVIVTVLGVATTTSSATQFTVITCASNCALSGTVSSTTGGQVSGVTITLSGGPSSPAPATTSSSGNYSFTGLTQGTYTVTASLAGYTFTPNAPSVSVGSSTTQNFTETSATTSYSISGTVTYAGSKTGRVFILVLPSGCTGGCGAVAGTSITLTSGSGSYTVRGLLPSGSGQNGNGSFTVFAWMDMSTLATGIQNASDPSGSDPSTVTITNADITGADVTITDPTPPTPVALDSSKISINPANGTAVIQYKAPQDSNGVEIATAYNVYYGTSNPPTSVKQFKAQGNNTNVFILTGLTNGVNHFQISALVGTTESTKTSVFTVTIGATSGNYTVSGTVTVPSGAGNGPMYVGVYGGSNGHTIYATRIPTPYTSPVSYSVSGVLNGTYQNFAIIDEANSGEITVPDLDNVGNHANPPTITVNNANVSNANIDLTPEDVPTKIQVQTNYQQFNSGSPYFLSFQVSWGVKRPVAITMTSGANMPVPFDMSVDENNSLQSPSFATAPQVGDAYQFQILFSDGTSQTLTATVTAVLGANSVAQNISETTTSPYSRTIPLFTWSAPASAPTTYFYAICVSGSSLNWCDYGHGSSNGLPSSQTNIVYNADGSASSSSLTTGTPYNINIIVIDANGDTAQTSSTYTP